MNTLERQRISNFTGLAGLFLVATVIGQGCAEDDNPAPATPTVTGGNSSGGTGAKGGKGGKSSGSGGDSTNAGNEAIGGGDATGGTSNSTGGTSNNTGGSNSSGGTGNHNTGGTGNVPIGGSGDVGNEGGAANTGNEGGTGAVSCDRQGTDQCFPCKPEDGDNEQFLNQCNKAKCSHFDNAGRIQGFTQPLPSL